MSRLIAPVDSLGWRCGRIVANFYDSTGPIAPADSVILAPARCRILHSHALCECLFEHPPVRLDLFEVVEERAAEFVRRGREAVVVIASHPNAVPDDLDEAGFVLERNDPPRAPGLEVLPRRPVADEDRTAGLKSLGDDVPEVLPEGREEE